MIVGVYVIKAQFKIILLAENIHFFKKHVKIVSYDNKDLKNFIRNTRMKLTAVLKEVGHIFHFIIFTLQLCKLLPKSTLAHYNA